MKKDMSSRISMIISMLIFGTLGPFVRNVAVSSGELALYRAALASIFVMAFLVLSRKKISFEGAKSELWLLLISGGAMGVNWILLFEAYKHTSVSVATLSYYFAPVIVTVLCPLIFREKMTAKQIICFVMSSVGLLLIIGPESLRGGSVLGVLLGLSAAAFYASVMILNKFIKNVGGITRTLFQFIAAIIVLIPYVALTGGVSIGQLDLNGWVNLLIVGLVHTGLAYCLYFPSLRELSGQETAVLCYIDPLVAIVVSVAVLSESITPWQIAGGALILGFTLLNEIDAVKS